MTRLAAEELLGKIAVIGMSGRYPKAHDLDQFWENLIEGRECISFYNDQELLDAGLPHELIKNPNYVKALGACESTFLFDASFFGYLPREAELLDPQHRILMECAWESLEYAGYDPWRYAGRIGMFAGSGATEYLFDLLSIPEIWNASSRFALLTYNDRDFLATQVGYKLNLRGPCITVQTACSTSLVAIILACQSLLTYQSDIALAGGVTLDAKDCGGHLFHPGGVTSVDGHCRAFDASASGIVGGCGAGVVVLKRLQDALADRDTIHAVIRGFGLNNDGAERVGFVAPGVEGQVKVYSDAIAMAGISPETIGFIECHGTGTPMGDPIEVAALTKAFRFHTQKRNFCAIGSVKTNIGHTGAAAGVAGFTKVVLALKNRMIPPSLHFRTPNPQLGLDQSPFYVNTEAKLWPKGATPRRGATTSLGAGGTNAHIIVEEAPEQPSSTTARPYHLLPVSAKTPEALSALRSNLTQHLMRQGKHSLADLAYTLQVGRKIFPHRQFVVCSTDNAVEMLNAAQNTGGVFKDKSAGSVVFLFPGQGSQYPNMAKDLYAIEPSFREQIDLCSEIVRPELGFDLRDIIYCQSHAQDAATQLGQTQYTQPALFAVEYALAKTWMMWGLQPECMIGHSSGEYTAACLAGVFSLQAALRLVVVRGRLMQQAQPGAMTAVMLSTKDTKTMLAQYPEVSLAAINGPSACVISGRTEAVAEVEQKLTQQEVPYGRLKVSCAAHSSIMDTILPEFRKELKKVKLNPPRLRYMSNLTGTWITESEVTTPDYWVSHLRQPVNFYEAVKESLKRPGRIFLEVGPGRTLTSLIAQYPEETAAPVRVCSLPHPKDASQNSFAFLLNAVGQLWLEGGDFDWQALHAGEDLRRIPLPTYPFERHYYRITVARHSEVRAADNLLTYGNLPAQEQTTKHSVQIITDHNRPYLSSRFVRPGNHLERILAELWESALGIRDLGIHDNFVELGGHSLVAIQLASRISEALAVPYTVEHLYEAPTIAETACLVIRLLARGADKGSDHHQKAAVYRGLQSPLVPIRATGTRQRLFLVHPGGGGIKVYQQLAKYLDPEQPIYAFQCYVLGSHKGHPLIPVEEMAAHYIRSLRHVQPAGPYLLAGWSTGGVIAFEMAVQIQKAGEETSLVGIFDAASRHYPEREPKDPNTRLIDDILSTGEALAAREGQKFTLTRDDLEHLQEEEQVQKLLKELRTRQIVPPEVDAEALRALLETFTNTNKALEYYIPGMYHGRVVVLRASEVTPDLRELTRDIYDDASFGWQSYCSQPVDVRYVPGDHMHIAVEPNIQKLGAIFQKCIDELKEAHSSVRIDPGAALIP